LLQSKGELEKVGAKERSLILDETDLFRLKGGKRSQ